MPKMSESPKLPVLQNSSDCGCDRRDVIQGIAVGALVAGVAGCRIDDPAGGDDTGFDAAPGDGIVGTGVTMCGANVCVDLTHPANVNLTMVGKSKVVISGTKKIIAIRTTDTEILTLTAICTHTGCTVGFQAAANNIRCPCHGSVYMLDGSNVSGPAPTPLKVFTNTFDMAGNLLTIMIA